MNKNLYLDLHALQTVPPSCINRDDTGSPKTAMYGGTLRSRVSSQSWKRAMRLMFKDEFESEKLGYRTRHVSYLIKKKLKEINAEIDEQKAEELSHKFLQIAEIESSEKKRQKEKKVLFFISAKQIESIARIADSYFREQVESMKKKDKDSKEKEYEKLIKEAINKEQSVDIMLFGRMSAKNNNLNYDAAAQVAHAISTHTISNEYDYFTACDDVNITDNEGAGHLGTVEYNSSTLYRYATVNLGELFYKDDLTIDEVTNIVKGFTNAFIKSMPTGKQNTFANRTLPYFVYATIREDQPINLVGAFEKPIKRSEEGFEIASEKALIDESKCVYENYTAKPKYAFFIGSNNEYDVDEKMSFKVNFNGLINRLTNVVTNELGKED